MPPSVVGYSLIIVELIAAPIPTMARAKPIHTSTENKTITPHIARVKPASKRVRVINIFIMLSLYQV